jgi:hypothetical protein
LFRIYPEFNWCNFKSQTSSLITTLIVM